MPMPLAGARFVLPLRRDRIDDFIHGVGTEADTLEVVPEDWLVHGGYRAMRLYELSGLYRLTAYGDSLALAGTESLDEGLVRGTRMFLDDYAMASYTERLVAEDGRMPVSVFTTGFDNACARIARVQDMLGRRIAIANGRCEGRDARRLVDGLLRIAERTGCRLQPDLPALLRSTRSIDDACEALDTLPSPCVRGWRVASSADALLDHAERRLGVRPVVLEGATRAVAGLTMPSFLTEHATARTAAS